VTFYKTKKFDRIARKLHLQDADIRQAGREIIAGHFEADLGGGVIKKRVALAKGKSGGARVIIFFKRDSRLFFYDVWAKAEINHKGTKEIEDDELDAYKSMAKYYFGWDEQKLTDLIEAGALKEV
jgi:hypothetical protein